MATAQLLRPLAARPHVHPSATMLAQPLRDRMVGNHPPAQFNTKAGTAHHPRTLSLTSGWIL